MLVAIVAPAEVPPIVRLVEGMVVAASMRGCGCDCVGADVDVSVCCLSMTMSLATILRVSSASLKLDGNLCSGANRYAGITTTA